MASTSPSDAWVMLYPKKYHKTLLRLFCFPYAGGGATIFRRWANDSPENVELCAVQLPGRQGRLTEPPFVRLSLLVESLSYVLRSYMDVPFAFFGHSMGALISFELTRQLRRQNSPGPAYLFVSGQRGPQLPNPFPPIHVLPESRFVEELRRLKGTPEVLLQDAELMQLVLPTLRADLEVCETYAYRAEDPLNCPISAFGGSQDRKISRADLIAWRDQTRSAFSLRMFPGDHFFLHTARALLLQAISQDWTQQTSPDDAGSSKLLMNQE
jgi:medium-chain acyl-[acyl-carrier-protein] hydrolase